MVVALISPRNAAMPRVMICSLRRFSISRFPLKTDVPRRNSFITAVIRSCLVTSTLSHSDAAGSLPTTNLVFTLMILARIPGLSRKFITTAQQRHRVRVITRTQALHINRYPAPLGNAPLLGRDGDHLTIMQLSHVCVHAG